MVSVRIMGIDLGSKRIGLAVSDEKGTIAFPAGCLDSRGRKKDLAALRAFISEREIVRVVVGLPLHMDGRRGPEADKATRFAEDLQAAAGVPVDTLDERWTSMEAERLMAPAPGKRRTNKRAGRREKGREKSREKGTVDEMAASIILRTYLERRSLAQPPATEDARDAETGDESR